MSLAALNDLALRLASDDPNLSAWIETSFERSSSFLTDLNDPIFADVVNPLTCIKIEVLQRSIDDIRVRVSDELGPTLGVAAGFNSLDGD